MTDMTTMATPTPADFAEHLNIDKLFKQFHEFMGNTKRTTAPRQFFSPAEITRISSTARKQNIDKMKSPDVEGRKFNEREAYYNKMMAKFMNDDLFKYIEQLVEMRVNYALQRYLEKNMSEMYA